MGIVFVAAGCVLALVAATAWTVRRAWRRAWDDLGPRATARGPGAGYGTGAWPAGTGARGGAPAHDAGGSSSPSSWWEADAGGGAPDGCSGDGSSSCGSSSSSCGSSSSSCGSSSSSCGSSSSSCGSSC